MTDHAYAAGLFDGEGYVCIDMSRNAKGRKMRCGVNVANTDRRPLDWLQETYGGNVYVGRVTKGGRISYTWELNGRSCLDFARAIVFYLKVKREQVIVLFHMLATVRDRGNSAWMQPLTEGEWEHRTMLRDRLLEIRAA